MSLNKLNDIAFTKPSFLVPLVLAPTSKKNFLFEDTFCDEIEKIFSQFLYFFYTSNLPPKEILLNGKAGIFFKMNDYKDLSKKIIYVYKNKNYYIHM